MVARAAEELALPLPGKSSCCIRGKLILFFLNNSRKARKQGSVILAETSASLEWCPAACTGIAVAFWAESGRCQSAFRLCGKAGALVYPFPRITGNNPN